MVKSRRCDDENYDGKKPKYRHHDGENNLFDKVSFGLKKPKKELSS
jgi:hypothetical protein